MTPVISPREKEVLLLIAFENTSEEIAQKLFISNHTAKSHRKNLLEKLYLFTGLRAINTANNQIAAVSAAANFTTLPGGSYQVLGASYSTAVNPAAWVGQSTTQILSGGSCVLFSTNSRPVNVTGAPCTTPPTINSVTAVQPDCNTPVGSITINATGNSTLQYSVDGGANWQAGNVFNNLAPGNYTVSVRLQAMTNCVTSYNQNPVMLNTPMGCGGTCTD